MIGIGQTNICMCPRNPDGDRIGGSSVCPMHGGGCGGGGSGGVGGVGSAGGVGGSGPVTEVVLMETYLRVCRERDALLLQKSEWIKCSDRPPDPDQEVVFRVFFARTGRPIRTVGSRSKGGGWGDAECTYSDESVTHWMSLPEVSA